MSGIVVIDFGMGNLRSVARALAHVGARNVILSGDPAVIAGADRVVFPGQGAIGTFAARLAQPGMAQTLREVARTRPLLGICIGLQALYEHSEEDSGCAGLGLLPGTVRRFPPVAVDGTRLKVPQIGWNQVAQSRAHPLWAGIEPDSWFYFVHSYFANPGPEALVAGVSEYGGHAFAAAMAQGPVFATQFHPEKSHHAGLRLLANFVTWDGDV